MTARDWADERARLLLASSGLPPLQETIASALRAARAEGAEEERADARIAAFAKRYGTGGTLRISYDHGAPPMEDPWRIEWRRFYPDAGLSDCRELEASSLRQALAGAEAWEEENDALEGGASSGRGGGEG